ncbi:peptidoglycan recognition protein family protein [Enemella dayhoffiae]|uniref:peptidoglycan recognition protein family protein n=1 Tax=Enemella dayhoffiae TaxID=2016507 RepID=UPI001E5C0F63|nr:peptidoglycan recognition family protein [Enemella dayhoffiae]
MCQNHEPVATEQSVAPEESTQGRLSRRVVLGGAAGLGVAGIAIGAGTLPALAAAPKQPKIHSTGDWGARQPTMRLNTINRRPTVLVVHHTASANSSDTSLSHAYAVARSIQNQHIGQGWGDSGQQFTISRGGHILEARTGTLKALATRKSFIEGIHAPGSNQTGIGIENEGMYTESTPPKAQWDALVSLLAYLCWAYDISPSRIIGHKDSPGSATRCPGEAFHARLAQLRADVTKALKPKPTIVPTPSRTATKTPSKTATATRSATKEPTRTATPERTPERTPSSSRPSNRNTPNQTPEGTPSPRRSPRGTAEPSPRRTPENTATPGRTASPRSTASPSPTASPSATVSPTSTTPTPSATTSAPAPQEVPVPRAGHKAAPNEAPLAAEGPRETATGSSQPVSAPSGTDAKESSGGLASTGDSRGSRGGDRAFGGGLGLGGLALAVGVGFLARRGEGRAAEQQRATAGNQSPTS